MTIPATSFAMRPLHCGMFAVDIASFSSRQDPSVQRHLRSAIHRITREACQTVGLGWETSHHEDRGDGLFVIASPQTSIEDLLGPLVSALLAGIRDHNKVSNDAAMIQLRVAVHAGYVHLDDYGATGRALIHLFRLLEAPEFKASLAECSGDFALIVSNYLFEEVISYNPGLIGAASFRPINVKVKETDELGWMWLPPANSLAGGPSTRDAPLTEVRAAALSALIQELAEGLIAEQNDDRRRGEFAALLSTMARRLDEASRGRELSPAEASETLGLPAGDTPLDD